MIQNLTKQERDFDSDFEVADAITDQVERWQRDRAEFNIDELIGLIPALPGYPESKAAAMAAGLTKLRAAGASLTEAADVLKRQYPHMTTFVEDAVVIERTLLSSSALHSQAARIPRPELPHECGPLIESGTGLRYRLESFAGSGSFGAVYRAIDEAMTSPDRPATVAVKLTNSSQSDERLNDLEAIKARRVEHPGVVRVLDHGTDHDLDCRFTVFEWVDGCHLGVWAMDDRSVCDKLNAVRDVAAAVDAIHRAGVVHCDLKPSNILIDSTDRARVTDIGLARVVTQYEPGTRGMEHRYRASWAFMSPEQAIGHRDIGPAADVYSLGAILYWLMTGNYVAGSTQAKIQDFHNKCLKSGDPPLMEQVGDFQLRGVIRRCLSPEPDTRYTSAQQLARDLDQVLESRPIKWMNLGTTRRTGMLLRRRPLTVALVAAAAVASSAGAKFAYNASVLDTKVQLQEQNKQAVSEGLATLFATEQNGSGVPERLMALHWFFDVLERRDIMDEVMSPERSGAERVAMARNARDQLPENSMERALWGLCLSLWLLDDPTPNESHTIASETHQFMNSRLGPTDPFTVQAGILLYSAEIKERWHQHSRTDRPNTAERLELKALVEQMEALLGEVAAVHRDNAIERMAYRTLANAHERRLLDEPNRRRHYDELITKRRDHVDASHVP